MSYYFILWRKNKIFTFKSQVQILSYITIYYGTKVHQSLLWSVQYITASGLFISVQVKIFNSLTCFSLLLWAAIEYNIIILVTNFTWKVRVNICYKIQSVLMWFTFFFVLETGILKHYIWGNWNIVRSIVRT